MTSRLWLMITVWTCLAWTTGCGRSAGHSDEAAAVAAIQRLGGKVEFDTNGPDRRVQKVYLHQTRVRDDDLAVFEKLPKLQNVFLGKTDITDEGLKHLELATELRTISLNGTRVTDRGLLHLKDLKQLKTVNLQETKVTPAGIAAIKKDLSTTTFAR